MKHIILAYAAIFGLLSPVWAQISVPKTLKSTPFRNQNSVSLQKSQSETLRLQLEKSPAKMKNTFKSMDGGVINGGGGDARLIRSLLLSSKQDALAQKVTEAFTRTDMTNIRYLLTWFIRDPRVLEKHPGAFAILKDMIDKGFQQDLFKTAFEIRPSCVDYAKKEKAAVARMNEPRSAICINSQKIANEFGPYIQDSDLVALLMHEFAHHYGHLDADHSFAAAVAQVYQTDSEERSQDGESLNYIIR